jgi:hypothetical protein
MEQEPIYVPSDKLQVVCEDVLGRIYEARQTDRERYVLARTATYNAAILQSNQRKRWLRIFGWRPAMFITPLGMEDQIAQEVGAMPEGDKVNHPMIQIHRQYGQLEHEAKDAMIMARLSDVVPISPDFARGLSHLGVDPGFMRRAPFGFIPTRPTKSA